LNAEIAAEQRLRGTRHINQTNIGCIDESQLKIGPDSIAQPPGCFFNFWIPAEACPRMVSSGAGMTANSSNDL
jgi:hypothetical protein